MKKKILIVAVAAMFVGLLGLPACGCGAPNAEVARVEQGLKDAGYTVVTVSLMGLTTVGAYKSDNDSNKANYSTNQTMRDAARSKGEETPGVAAVKSKGNWVYHGDSAFIAVMDEILK